MKLAGLLSLVGPVEDNASLSYGYINLFIRADRVARWSTAVAAIPADPEIIVRIPTAANAWTQVTGLAIPQNINLTTFVTIAAELRDPERYVSNCLREGFTHFGGIFHPNTFKVAQRTQRGEFGPLANPDYVRDAWSTVEEVE